MSTDQGDAPKSRWIGAGWITWGGWLAGWLLILAGVGEVIEGRPYHAVWLLGGGVVALAIGGTRPLRTFAREGLEKVLEEGRANGEKREDRPERRFRISRLRR